MSRGPLSLVAGAARYWPPVPRRPFAKALAAIAALAALVPALAACGDGGDRDGTATAASRQQASAGAVAPLPRSRPQAIEPVAGLPSGGDPASAGSSSGSEPLPQPVSDSQIKRELVAAGVPAGDRAGLTRRGLAVAPLGAPAEVQEVIQAGNQIARLPYRYGGGHATWIDTAYDCSASVSFAFAAAGLIGEPMDSTALSRWGDAGRGRWITIYANAGHAWMTVAGLRFDTGGLRATGSRWQDTGRGTGGFVVRHPPGL